MRVGIAIEEPETSAFFDDAKRLVIGQPNTVSTTYSSADVATRSRLRLPEGFTAAPHVKSPNEIDYTVTTPPKRCTAIGPTWRLKPTASCSAAPACNCSGRRPSG